jgi:hypothetical protein
MSARKRLPSVATRGYVPLTAAVLVVAASLRLASQTFEIEVRDARPVAKAAVLLEGNNGFVVTYEDPPYLNAADLDDVTKVPQGGRRAMIPKARTIEVREGFSRRNGSETPTAMVNRVLDADAQSQTGARNFEVRSSGAILHIVPTRVRNEVGDWVAVKPILDQPVTIPLGTRSHYALLQMLCESLTASTGAKVSMFTVPVNRLANRVVESEAKNEPARSVLLRVMADIGVPLSWHFLYDPSGKQFFLNLGSPGKLMP